MESAKAKLTLSEAGYLGYLASKEKCEANFQARMDEYNLNPNICKCCGKFLDYEHRHNKFCDQSCAATYNNRQRKSKIKICKKCGVEYEAFSANSYYCDRCKRKTKLSITDKSGTGRMIISTCLNCGKEIKGRREVIYCDGKCQQEYKWKQTKQRILEAGEFDAAGGIVTKGETNRTQAKRFLEEEYGHKCAICGLSEWMGQPIPLVVDHIDGDPLNHKIENFRLVCGNCDMQLPTYKAKNKGKGRKYRRTLYQTDKDTEQR